MRHVASALAVLLFLGVVFGGPIREIRGGHWPGKGVSAPDWEELRSGNYAKLIETRLEAGSQLKGIAQPKYNEARFLAFGTANQGVVVGPNDWLFLSHRLTRPNEHQLRYVEKNVDAMADIGAFLEERGTRTVIALLPRKQSVFPEELPSADVVDYFPLFDLQRDLMLERGLDVPDLREAIRGAEERPYFVNDEHWRPAGANAAAHALADHLRQLYAPDPVPGRPLETHMVTLPSRPFIEQEQRRLGFAKDGWLFDRFSDTVEEMRAAKVGTQDRFHLGSIEPEPVFLLGTSMTGGPYWLTSHLMNALGVHVQTYNRDGYAAGYRALDQFCKWLTGAQPFPEAFVWEIPEDFVPREAEYIHAPLRMVTDLFPGYPYAVEPVDINAPNQEGITDRSMKEGGILRARSTTAEANLSLEVPEALAAAPGLALKFHLTVPPGQPYHSGMARVTWTGEDRGTALGERTVPIRITRHLHPVVIPLTAPEGTPVRWIQIHPYSKPTVFEFGAVELWRSEEGR